MAEILGLLDELEAQILDAKRLPFSNKALVDDKLFLTVIDKIRLLSKQDTHVSAREMIDSSKKSTSNKETGSVPSQIEALIEAKTSADHIRVEANEYADNVLAQLQLLVTKLHKNLIRLEKNIDDGRISLEDTQKQNLQEVLDET